MAATKARRMSRRAPVVRAQGRGGVALAFARDGSGRLVAAATLDEASRLSRAPFACPGCGEALVARLGTVRARHFAHRPGSTCPLTAPETALHFNAKQRLLALCAEAFRGDRRVTLLTRCERCRRSDLSDLSVLGDGAVAEGAVGGFRADVLVTSRGVPALAMEVLVTHAVEVEKVARLHAAGVPVIEVDARGEWVRERDPLEVEVVSHRSLGFGPCPACRSAEQSDRDRVLGGEAALVAELEAYRARGLFGERATPAAQPGKTTALPAPDAPLSRAERRALESRFRCPDCRSDSLEIGIRLARHGCPGGPPRPVAWRGYDGRLAELGWWKR
jgi:predicted RNA-binding Zn-ribbon protein involved in translation (DUF1610 family)